MIHYLILSFEFESRLIFLFQSENEKKKKKNLELFLPKGKTEEIFFLGVVKHPVPGLAGGLKEAPERMKN